jgi:hypothetical protein
MAKRGPKPLGARPMTPAERQARFRATRANKPRQHYRRPADRRSRQQRWRVAVDELLNIQADCQSWLDALPESLKGSPTTEALEAILCGRPERD